MFFITILIAINILYFNSILTGISVFFLMLFLSAFATRNFSTALISIAGFVLTQVCVLLASGAVFLGISIGIIYAGAILVMLLFILVLVSNSKFEVSSASNPEKTSIKKSSLDTNILINSVLFILISNHFKETAETLNSTDTTIFYKNLINANSHFYDFSYSEIYNLAAEMTFYSTPVFYILGLYISIASVLLLSLLRKLYY